MREVDKMSIDLNKMAEKLKKQREVGVSRDGKLTDKNPSNEGTDEDKKGHTTLKPQRFF